MRRYQPMPRSAGSKARAARARRRPSPCTDSLSAPKYAATAGGKLLALLCLLTLAGCSAVGCGQPASGWGVALGYPIRVACTTDMVAEMVRRVGGKHVRVDTLIPPGADPHQYVLDSAGKRTIEQATVVIHNGLHLEQGMGDVLEAASRRAYVFGVADGELESGGARLFRSATAEAGYDPHVWQDPSLWARCAEYVAEEFSRLDPAREGEYRANAESYCAELLALHEFCKQSIGEIPGPRRVVVSSHEAFNYLGAAYQVEVHAPQGVSTADKVDLYVIDDLPGMLAHRGIEAVFVEFGGSAEQLQKIIDGCRKIGHDDIRVVSLHVGGFGPTHTRVSSYERMIRYNMHALVDALR